MKGAKTNSAVNSATNTPSLWENKHLSPEEGIWVGHLASTVGKKAYFPHGTPVFGTSDAASLAEATHFRNHETMSPSHFVFLVLKANGKMSQHFLQVFVSN